MTWHLPKALPCTCGQRLLLAQVLGLWRVAFSTRLGSILPFFPPAVRISLWGSCPVPVFLVPSLPRGHGLFLGGAQPLRPPGGNS